MRQIVTQFNEILEGTKEIPSWMTYGRIELCQKYLVKRISVENFRPIISIPLKGKLFTGIISQDMYHFMENKNLLPEKEKDCWRKSKGTKDQPMIGKTILGCSKRRTNLAITWIDCRKAYDSVPHSWILECLDMLGSAHNVRSFLEKIMKKWKLLLNLKGSDLCEVDVNRGIF